MKTITAIAFGSVASALLALAGCTHDGYAANRSANNADDSRSAREVNQSFNSKRPAWTDENGTYDTSRDGVVVGNRSRERARFDSKRPDRASGAMMSGSSSGTLGDEQDQEFNSKRPDDVGMRFGDTYDGYGMVGTDDVAQPTSRPVIVPSDRADGATITY